MARSDFSKTSRVSLNNLIATKESVYKIVTGKEGVITDTIPAIKANLPSTTSTR